MDQRTNEWTNEWTNGPIQWTTLDGGELLGQTSRGVAAGVRRVRGGVEATERGYPLL